MRTHVLIMLGLLTAVALAAGCTSKTQQSTGSGDANQISGNTTVTDNTSSTGSGTNMTKNSTGNSTTMPGNSTLPK